MIGLRVILLHPEVASRSCSDCQQFLYFDRGPDEFGDRVTRGGKPVIRPKGVGTPCSWCPKIPPGMEPKPQNAVDLSNKNLAAVQFHRECDAAGGQFPLDAIVRRNAALIRAADDFAARVATLRHTPRGRM